MTENLFMVIILGKDTDIVLVLKHGFKTYQLKWSGKCCRCISNGCCRWSVPSFPVSHSHTQHFLQPCCLTLHLFYFWNFPLPLLWRRYIDAVPFTRKLLFFLSLWVSQQWWPSAAFLDLWTLHQSPHSLTTHGDSMLWCQLLQEKMR